MFAKVRVEEPTSRVPSKTTGSVEKTFALVPPRTMGRMPVKSEVERSSEAAEETAPEVTRSIPLASQLRLSALEMTWRVEED